MEQKNIDLINQFFAAYISKNREGINQVMSEQVKWHFLGTHPLAGVKKGITEVIHFFDTMATIMVQSNVISEKLIISSNAHYVVESQHIKTFREDGINIDHQVCVLWKFDQDKIIEGRHFFADPAAVNDFFAKVIRVI
jgi:uncharacterized protein